MHQVHDSERRQHQLAGSRTNISVYRNIVCKTNRVTTARLLCAQITQIYHRTGVHLSLSTLVTV